MGIGMLDKLILFIIYKRYLDEELMFVVHTFNKKNNLVLNLSWAEPKLSL